MLQKKFYIEEFVPSNEHAAEIIGFKGFKIKRISKETHTYIQCPSPNDLPIFRIFGDSKLSIKIARGKIREYAAHFDKMRNKKRQIKLRSGERLQTICFKKSEISCIIGRKGRQIKSIMTATNVSVISPDRNKEPIFIVVGKERNVEACILIMKIIAFCISGTNYFDHRELNLIHDFLNCNLADLYLSQSIYNIVNVKIFEEKFHKSNFTPRCFEENFTFYNCWKCRNKRIKVARALCNHIISCDVCIAHLYADIYLKCKVCNTKIENFLIEYYTE